MERLARNTPMRCSALAAAAWLGLALVGRPELASAQEDRDFVFTDEDGHLVLRYAGAGPGALEADRLEEIVNVQLSTMVHDRLRADTAFETEPVDLQWAGAAAARIERHLRDTQTAFSAVDVECRSDACRVLLEHASTWTVSAHQALMGTAQRAVRSFLEREPAGFEPVFLIAAHYQEPERPYLKLFLRRAADEPREGAPRTHPPAGR